ncbi:TPA: carbon-nitrogen hydrolase family protein [Citrobacter koseri]|uniref:carbon-nitrogen hydrolase family protein n=1 Tax=Citrobacter TaxID=544 RepID=UPI000E0ACFF0|nr:MULTISPECIES: carbon-nitrogen hydrolase family protein [Citrobacter]AYY75147.1 carbon-nitrogen hydrolase family protein [Citrobacter koseri]MBJ8938681.1 carbon-nitrogen hydrolase family protein [Citrobacter koseri]MBJ9172865.1 carbon-nitrogen hydrolase family protein [Citrobacter koseri]MDM2991045.1 carbon-nitrogen hydrolase family protein [Citrobacter sp. CK190]QCQ71180.1 carbon-nitrogen hydrolase family protein [Citrobacter sp. TBCP-5362]
MSHWKIAAAQYEPPRATLAEHVAHHLQFVEIAASQQCELLVFPSLSLTGCNDTAQALPVPPDESLLQPLAYAASAYRMTIIAGLPVEHNGQLVRGIAIFAPWVTSPLIFHQSHGACVARHRKTISVMDEQPEGIDIDPAFSLFTTSQCVSEHDLFTSTSRLQRFSHRFAIAVLMANAGGNSALWDESGQLIVRADSGSLLLTGQHTTRGWQGDIIPLR